jgi:ubiquinone/menaquinone biosynthesis C-methylase UbiE
MANDYNKIAFIYDTLSRLVYRKSIVQAQVFLLSYIKANDKILLVGGGTGWILEEIAKLRQQGTVVVYVEKSAAMIALAKKRKYPGVQVEFIETAIEDYATAEKFDIVVTPFLFDNFRKEKIDLVFEKLNKVLKPGGFWLYADFINDQQGKKYWQQFLLKTMYFFFRVTTKIEAQELIDMRPYFQQDFELAAQQMFYHQFIQAVAFRKK